MLPTSAITDDRVSRRKIIIVARTVMMISAFILAFFSRNKVACGVVSIAVVGFILGIANTFNWPAWR